MTDVVAEVRAELIVQLQWAGADVTEDVLAQVRKVAYTGDLDAYLVAAMRVAQGALAVALQPLLDRLNAEAASYRAKAEAVTARWVLMQAEFEQFRKMPTPKWRM